MLPICVSHQDLFGVQVSWLAHWTPDRVVRVRALAGFTVLCSWARHFALTACMTFHSAFLHPGV